MKPWALFSHSVGMLISGISANMLRVFSGWPTLLIVALLCNVSETDDRAVGTVLAMGRGNPDAGRIARS